MKRAKVSLCKNSVITDTYQGLVPHLSDHFLVPYYGLTSHCGYLIVYNPDKCIQMYSWDKLTEPFLRCMLTRNVSRCV
jgi:hypothetical protein